MVLQFVRALEQRHNLLCLLVHDLWQRITHGEYCSYLTTQIFTGPLRGRFKFSHTICECRAQRFPLCGLLQKGLLQPCVFLEKSLVDLIAPDGQGIYSLSFTGGHELILPNLTGLCVPLNDFHRFP